MGFELDKLSPFQAEDGGSAGGYLVFPQFEAKLINLKEKFGVLQQNAFRLPMQSDTLLITGVRRRHHGLLPGREFADHRVANAVRPGAGSSARSTRR